MFIKIAGEHNATNIATHEPTLEEVFLRFYEPEPEPDIEEGYIVVRQEPFR